MDSRIDVKKEIQESKQHEHFGFLVISLIGVVAPTILWIIFHTRIISVIWSGFFTVSMLLITIIFFVFGVIKTIMTTIAVSNYKRVLTKYVIIDETTHVPETASVTTCFRPDFERFGFQKINYFFWKDNTELVFFPVRPDFLSSKNYHRVHSVRLNESMIRYFKLTGNQYYDGLKEEQKTKEELADAKSKKRDPKLFFRDTRATLVAYAVGEQTVFLMFDVGLYEKLKEYYIQKEIPAVEVSENTKIFVPVHSDIEETAEILEAEKTNEWKNLIDN